jgi:hypothetical protein
LFTATVGSEAADFEEGLYGGKDADGNELPEHPEFEVLRSEKRDDPLSAATTQDIEALIDWSGDFEYRPNSKLEALLGFLEAVCRPDGKTWADERVVVFTEYADTVNWLKMILDAQGFDDVTEVIQGSTKPEDRELIRARFAAAPTEEKVRILLATDAAGEGIDLQEYCHRLVNFDIPFNPSRLEQRIGRIDRYGQTYPPEIYYLVPDQRDGLYAGDEQFMRIIAKKVTQEIRDLGEVNPLIDDQISEHFIGLKPRARLSKNSAVINHALAGEQQLDSALTQLARDYQVTKQNMHLSPDNARRVINTALTITRQPRLEQNFVFAQDTEAEVFTVPELDRTWTRTLAGLDTKLKPGDYRPITFDDSVDDPRIVQIHLGHALLAKATRTLRANLFSSVSEANRVTAVVIPDLDTSCVAATARLVLVGRGGLRLHEEVFVTGLRLHGQDLAEDKAQRLLDQALDASHNRINLPDEAVRQRLVEDWNADGSRMRQRLERAMTQRAARRQGTVKRLLANRHEDDIARVQSIFAAFRDNLNDSLQKVRSEQAEQEAMLFADDQQNQRRRDILKMDARLLTLEDDERREIDGIHERYADVKPYVSAVALVFALTPDEAEDAAAETEATR